MSSASVVMRSKTMSMYRRAEVVIIALHVVQRLKQRLCM